MPNGCQNVATAKVASLNVCVHILELLLFIDAHRHCKRAVRLLEVYNLQFIVCTQTQTETANRMSEVFVELYKPRRRHFSPLKGRASAIAHFVCLPAGSLAIEFSLQQSKASWLDAWWRNENGMNLELGWQEDACA